MSDAVALVLWFGVGPLVSALIAHARGMEWWVGALLGLMGCVGVIIVSVMKPGHHVAARIPPPPPASQWAPDPTGRHELRLWDGTKWTPNVSTRGTSGWDPLPGP